MGYADSSAPSVSASAVKTASLYTADGGVDYSSDGLICENGKSPLIKNMRLKNGILTVRPPQTYVCDAPDGEVYSHRYFAEYEIFHIGSEIFAFSDFDGNMRLLCGGVPEKNSVPIEYGGKLYIYAETQVFTVDCSMNAEEAFPSAPLYGTNYSRLLGTGVKNQSFEPNILAPFVSVSYTQAASLEVTGYMFPRNMDKTRRFAVYCDGERIENVKSDEEYFYLPDGIKPQGDNSVVICCYVLGSEFEKCSALSGCVCGTAYGGGVLGGTRVILGGNPEYPGRFFVSELGNPLSFAENSGGNAGSGDITAFVRFGSDMLILTESSVYRMRYNYTSENGGYLSVHTLSSDVGCISPNSVSVCAGKPVFLGTGQSVYTVCGSEVFGTANTAAISQNIDGDDKIGLKSADCENRKNAQSAVCSEKYFLFIGEKAFVWDFGERSYTASSDYVKSAKNLVWFEFDGLKEAKAVCTLGGKLFFICADGVYTLGGEGQCSAVYRSKNMDFGMPHIFKSADAFRTVCKCGEDSRAVISFYADGRKYFEANAEFKPSDDGYAVFSAKLPPFWAKRFFFEIKTECADIGFMNIEIDYRTCRRISAE